MSSIHARSIGRALRSVAERRRNYRMRSTWNVPAAATHVRQLLADPADIARWWSTAFLSAESLKENARCANGTDAFRLRTKGFLPYTISFDAWVAECDEEALRLVVETSGDFDGHATITAAIDTARHTVRIDIDWNVRVVSRVLRAGSYVVRPLLIMNHRWVMRCGEAALRRELVRYSATDRIVAHRPAIVTSGTTA